MCQHGEQNKLIKDLGISTDTLRRWKKEFGLPIDSQIKYSDSKKLQVMGKYYKIKRKNPKISDRIIVNMLNIGYSSLCKNAGAVQDLITSEHPMPSSDDHLWAWNLRTKKRTERIEVEHSVKK
uniref:MerR family transcriptional regulator n=1 Tax=Globodera rostochiensis TaxID=31243 RepID=A0A914H9E0_GLORO